MVGTEWEDEKYLNHGSPAHGIPRRFHQNSLVCKNVSVQIPGQDQRAFSVSLPQFTFTHPENLGCFRHKFISKWISYYTTKSTIFSSIFHPSSRQFRACLNVFLASTEAISSFFCLLWKQFTPILCQIMLPVTAVREHLSPHIRL